MMKLSDRVWKTFDIEEVFEIVNLKPEHKVNLKILGNIPYVTRTEKNNGIESFYKGLHIKNGNCITFGAETAKFYYQEYDFINGNKLYAIYNDNLNKYIALFLTTLFKNQFSDYGYGFGLTGTRFSKKKIKLPTLDNQPDYDFMEKYIKDKYFILKSKIKDKQKYEIYDYRELNEVEWKDYYINTLFNFKRGNQNNMSDLKSGELPLISAKKTNNGYKDFVKKNNKQIYPSKIISLNNDGEGGVGIAYYQPFKSLIDTHVTALINKYRINKHAKLFVARMITTQRNKFSHGYAISTNRLNRQIIKLPTINKQPDYKFMEQYMKRKENEVLDRL
ncbi:restriction endonuclease subunit S [Staphylococcus saprophyticus]|uniref:restriction endonuclease subunit S n=1 Tax=Staphylococcus saprophyticus TaxID=29385 RepID=UPI00157DA833|nr:restriction endonuclease subunit S [Staphylococcus saprophyticus]QKQ05982.1 restriction endonuclease subunit S [Staphylococcus saprophyticus]